MKRTAPLVLSMLLAPPAQAVPIAFDMESELQLRAFVSLPVPLVQTASGPLLLHVEGELDPDSLLLSSLSVFMNTPHLSLTTEPFSVTRTIDPPGFEPPTVETLGNIRLESEWTLDVLLVPQPSARIDPGTLRSEWIRFPWMEMGSLVTHVTVDGEPVLTPYSFIFMGRPGLEIQCASDLTCSGRQFTFGRGPELASSILSNNLSDTSFSDLWQPELEGEYSPRTGNVTVFAPGQIKLHDNFGVPVPEPATGGLLGLAALSLASRRRSPSGRSASTSTPPGT